MSTVRVHTEKGTHDYPDAKYVRDPQAGGLDILDDGEAPTERAHHVAGSFTHVAYLYDGDEREARKAHEDRQAKGHKPADEPKHEAPRKA